MYVIREPGRVPLRTKAGSLSPTRVPATRLRSARHTASDLGARVAEGGALGEGALAPVVEEAELGGAGKRVVLAALDELREVGGWAGG